VDQRGQRVHVVALEGVDVPGEELGIASIDRQRRFRGHIHRRQRRARSLEGTVDRRHARIEELGDLRCLPAEDLAQNQHRSLPRREVL
jgi:hypothetical protein